VPGLNVAGLTGTDGPYLASAYGQESSFKLPENATDWTRVGCFFSNSNPTLDNTNSFYDAYMTPERCTAACGKTGKPFAAMQKRGDPYVSPHKCSHLDDTDVDLRELLRYACVVAVSRSWPRWSHLNVHFLAQATHRKPAEECTFGKCTTAPTPPPETEDVTCRPATQRLPDLTQARRTVSVQP
jgi:hypothetical protein